MQTPDDKTGTADEKETIVAPASLSSILAGLISKRVAEETKRRLDSLRPLQSAQLTYVDQLCSSLLSSSAFDAMTEANQLQRLNLRREEAIQCFEHAAATLGTIWNADEGDFFDVTVGMSRLQSVLRTYIQLRNSEPAFSHSDCNVLICTMPGEEHTFASTLLELNMRLLGWNTTLFFTKSHKELGAKVTTNCYNVICLSWTTAALTESMALLSQTIDSFEETNRPIVIAGGLSSEKRGKWLVRIGVDHVCYSALEAVDVVRKVISSRDQSKSFHAQELQAARPGKGSA